MIEIGRDGKLIKREKRENTAGNKGSIKRPEVKKEDSDSSKKANKRTNVMTPQIKTMRQEWINMRIKLVDISKRLISEVSKINSPIGRRMSQELKAGMAKIDMPLKMMALEVVSLEDL